MHSNRIKNIEQTFFDHFKSDLFVNMTVSVLTLLDLSANSGKQLIEDNDFINRYYYELENGNTFSIQERMDQLYEWEDQLNEARVAQNEQPENNAIKSRIYALETDIDDLRNAKPILYNIFEWWLVPHTLSAQLAKRGETILDLGNITCWGRRCTGQVIWMDEVIIKIYDSLSS